MVSQCTLLGRGGGGAEVKWSMGLQCIYGADGGGGGRGIAGGGKILTINKIMDFLHCTKSTFLLYTSEVLILD